MKNLHSIEITADELNTIMGTLSSKVDRLSYAITRSDNHKEERVQLIEKLEELLDKLEKQANFL